MDSNRIWPAAWQPSLSATQMHLKMFLGVTRWVRLYRWGWFHWKLWLFFHSSSTFLNVCCSLTRKGRRMPLTPSVCFSKPSGVKTGRERMHLEVPYPTSSLFRQLTLKSRKWRDLMKIPQKKGFGPGSKCAPPDWQWHASPHSSTVPRFPHPVRKRANRELLLSHQSTVQPNHSTLVASAPTASRGDTS